MDFGLDLRASSGFNAQNSGSCIVLASSSVPRSFTGTLVETELAKIVIPGGLMGPDGELRIKQLWTFTNSANNKTMRVYMGGVMYQQQVLTTQTPLQGNTTIANRGSNNSQAGVSTNIHGVSAATSSLGFVTGAVNTSIDQIISITGILANIADTLTLQGYTVEVLNPL